MHNKTRNVLYVLKCTSKVNMIHFDVDFKTVYVIYIIRFLYGFVAHCKRIEWLMGHVHLKASFEQK